MARFHSTIREAEQIDSAPASPGATLGQPVTGSLGRPLWEGLEVMVSRAESGSDRWKRILLGLPDVRLRIDWLDAQVQTEPAEAIAPLLDVIIGESKVAEPKAREALLTIALW